MSRSVFLLLLLPLLLAGCGGYYKIPKQEYQERVQTLGVLPILVDADSTILRPDRAEVLDLLRRMSSGREGRLIEILREQKTYFDVRPVAGDPEALFGRLVLNRALRGEGDKLYRRYQFSAQAAAELARDNAVDALLVIILNGVVRPETRWDNPPTTFLKTDYNSILATAAVVLPSGPGGAGEGFLPLQYPDFAEAKYNKTEQVKVKEISLVGLERALVEREKSLFGGSGFPFLYRVLFEEIASGLKPGLLSPLSSQPAAPAPAPAQPQ
jgi:hypothetical protein